MALILEGLGLGHVTSVLRLGLGSQVLVNITDNSNNDSSDLEMIRTTETVAPGVIIGPALKVVDVKIVSDAWIEL